jgi:hypothetical protein
MVVYFISVLHSYEFYTVTLKMTWSGVIGDGSWNPWCMLHILNFKVLGKQLFSIYFPPAGCSLWISFHFFCKVCTVIVSIPMFDLFPCFRIILKYRFHLTFSCMWRVFSPYSYLILGSPLHVNWRGNTFVCRHLFWQGSAPPMD